MLTIVDRNKVPSNVANLFNLIYNDSIENKISHENALENAVNYICEFGFKYERR